jgi:hypothetical protein
MVGGLFRNDNRTTGARDHFKKTAQPLTRFAVTKLRH